MIRQVSLLPYYCLLNTIEKRYCHIGSKSNIVAYLYFYANFYNLPDLKINDWLPITRQEANLRGWDEVDVIIVSGDAYVDHPSFGAAMIARYIEYQGYKVAIIPQPNWRDDLRDFKKFGKPRLFFGVTAGSMDSMVNHYTAHKRKRSDDAYTPGNQSGFRPDYASIVYSQILKKIYPDTPVVLGGVEASLRRITHYDYWSDSLKPSILIESGADVLVYGMGILPLKPLLDHFYNKKNTEDLKFCNQVAFVTDYSEIQAIKKDFKNILEIASHEDCLKNKDVFAESFKKIEIESNKLTPKTIIQKHGTKVVVITPCFPPMTSNEVDSSYDLPYTRKPHPKYKNRGPIPAYEMIRHSITTHLGCFGGCSFCTISAHQGKFISSRSEKSILNEVGAICKMDDFKGYISDLGGPSANMYRMAGFDLEQCSKCSRFSCIYPHKCANLNDSHKPLIDLYKKAAATESVKKVFIGSGIRYDMFIGKTPMEDKKNFYSQYFKQLVKHHVSGRLKVAPEHTSEKVLKIMRKPSFKLYKELQEKFKQISSESHLNQQIIPYFISSHPGCTLGDMAECAIETKNYGLHLEQVQDFTPTPMTLASVMYYSGIDPHTKLPVFVAKSMDEKKDQKLFFFWYSKPNKQRIINLLNKIGKQEFISGFYPASRFVKLKSNKR